MRVLLFNGELCKGSFLTSNRENVGQYSLELTCIALAATATVNPSTEVHSQQ